MVDQQLAPVLAGERQAEDAAVALEGVREAIVDQQSTLTSDEQPERMEENETTGTMVDENASNVTAANASAGRIDDSESVLGCVDDGELTQAENPEAKWKAAAADVISSKSSAKERRLKTSDLFQPLSKEERRDYLHHRRAIEKLREYKQVHARVNLLKYQMAILDGSDDAETALKWLEMETTAITGSSATGCVMRPQFSGNTTGMSKPMFPESDAGAVAPKAPYALPIFGGSSQRHERQPLRTFPLLQVIVTPALMMSRNSMMIQGMH